MDRTQVVSVFHPQRWEVRLNKTGTAAVDGTLRLGRRRGRYLESGVWSSWISCWASHQPPLLLLLASSCPSSRHHIPVVYLSSLATAQDRCRDSNPRRLVSCHAWTSPRTRWLPRS